MTDTDPEATRSHDLLDPRKLKMANRGYYIQSKILHVPDQFGFFSAGPPWLQVMDAECFTRVLAYLAIVGTLEALILAYLWRNESFEWFVVYEFLVINCELIVAIWIIVCVAHYTKRGHDEGS
ncbi:uncharacterized protein FSUBG_5678 [Fusarium subglutinans]|uniref:Uncharacterized protein n=1 Tax=Gibberella subglutinans TaxID=42677 RepID=A0A8H5V0Z9_GIBSU|nr:uncharacterized protein FSUBG_5678 [Fusarium subglutinans]KAF5606842.1 hypothetical protein FSUBG_5678 [Fusarium subglutinans]